MLKKLKSLLPVILILMLSLVGCGGPKNGKEMIQAAYEKSSNLESYTMKMDLNLAVKSEKTSIMNMNMTSNMEGIVKPKAMIKMDSKIEMSLNGEKQSMPMLQYIEQTDKGLTMYQNMSGMWFKSTVEDPAIVKQMSQDISSSLKVYMDNMVKSEIVGEEKVGEVDCHKINAVISKNAFKEIMAQMGGMESISPQIKELMDSKEFVDKMEDLTITIWTNKETNEFVKQKVDLSKLMGTVLKPELEKQDTIKDKITDIEAVVEMQYTGYNNVKEIVLPDEAKNAQDLPIQ